MKSHGVFGCPVLSMASGLRRVAVLAIGLAIASGARGEDAIPDPVRSFSHEIPRIFSELENLVARETMTQVIFDQSSDRAFRKRVILSDYQIAHLEEEPDALWEFRFVKEVDGKTVPGADRQIEDFLRLRHRDAREERIRITNLGLSQSLPGCYWHNLTLVLHAFQGSNAENFAWRRSGNVWIFEQVRGPGIPENLFDARSARHYPSGSLAFSTGSLSRLELEWTANGLVTKVLLEFTRPEAPDFIPRPRRYVAKKQRASNLRTLVQTTFEYGEYRRFSVKSESEMKGPGTRQ